MLKISLLLFFLVACNSEDSVADTQSKEDVVSEVKNKPVEKSKTENPKEVEDPKEGDSPKEVENPVILGNDFSVPSFLEGQDPAPDNMTWTKLENLSDEFNGSSLDETKWLNTDPKRWVGRPPGLFVKNSVSEADGDLMLTVDRLPAPQIVNGSTFNYSCSNIFSKAFVAVGTYTESRIKANKTFLSTTFWLINNKGKEQGCDKRVTELDVTEMVGKITGSNKGFDERMNSNTHSRQIDCEDQHTKGSKGGKVGIGGKVWEDYHIYGVWWKSPKEILFFLDGKKVYTINPVADFNLLMQLRLVTETYDWNKPPADGGVNGSFEDRTSYYDWVRSWKLQ